MKKLLFRSAGDSADLVVDSYEQATNLETGEPVRAAIVTFTNGKTAIVSANEFASDGTPLFCTEDALLANGYQRKLMSSGQHWIINTKNQKQVRIG